MSKLFTLCLLLLTGFKCFGQPGRLDSSFGRDGWVNTRLSSGNVLSETARAVLPQPDGSYIVQLGLNGTLLTRYNRDGSQDLTYGTQGYSRPVKLFAGTAVRQPDGKVVLVGFTTTDVSDSDEKIEDVIILVRYNTDGSLDNTFSDDGILITDILSGTGVIDRATSLALQQDGKMVIVSNIQNPATGNQDFALARFLNDGSLDRTFGKKGIITTDFGAHDFATSIAVQQDGKIIAAGIFDYFDFKPDFALARYNPDGTPDTSFSEDGKLTTAIGSKASLSSIALQQDGKIVAGGQVFSTSTKSLDFVLARYNVDGTLDDAFDKDGKLTTNILTDDIATSVEVQQDGKIIAAGHTFSEGAGSFALVRYQHDGMLDLSFNGDGKLTTAIGSKASLSSIALQQDGKTVAAGFAYDAGTGQSDFALVRYHTNGALDNTFNGNGVVTGFYPFGGQLEYNNIGVQPDGKIVVVGNTWDGNEGQYSFVLARYNRNGTPDSTFDKDGSLTTDVLEGSDYLFAVAVQQDGRILGAGRAFNPSTNEHHLALVRYSSDGTLDSTFGKDGKITTALGSNHLATSLALQPDGKILVATSAFKPGTANEDFFLARYNSNGTLDKSFGEGGQLTTDVSGNVDYAAAIALQPDGKIVVGGSSLNAGSFSIDMAVVRYNTDGTLDQSFGKAGKLTTDFTRREDEATALLLQPDGKIVVAGSTLDPKTAASSFVLARYSADGTWDSTFNKGGTRTTDRLGHGKAGYDRATALALQQDGKIVVAGSTGTLIPEQSDIALARYNTDGTLDKSFEGDGTLITDLGSNEQVNGMALAGNRLYVAGTADVLARNGIIAAYLLEESTPPAVVSSFTLVDASKDADIAPLQDGAVINLSKVKGKAINIKANTKPSRVGSVVLQLAGDHKRKQVENGAPYALFGDLARNYKGWKPPVGSYTLRATPYSQKEGSGTAGTPHTIAFTVVDIPELSHFILVNASTGKDIGGLKEGAIVDLSLTPVINIRAAAGTVEVGSVSFALNSQTAFRLENGAPFALAGDSQGDYFSWQVSPGTYTIKATPFSHNDGEGTAGKAIQITITVINSNQLPAGITQKSDRTRPVPSLVEALYLQVYPNPFGSGTLVQFSVPHNTTVSLVLVDGGGRVLKRIYQGRATAKQLYTISLGADGLPSGTYFCRLINAEGQTKGIKMVRSGLSINNH